MALSKAPLYCFQAQRECHIPSAAHYNATRTIVIPPNGSLPRPMLPDDGGMRVPPPSVIATWPAPNYVDPVTRGNALLIVNVVFQSMATIAVVGRLYSRLYVRNWFGVDDAMMIVAYVLDVALTAVVMLAKERYGWDRHAWDLPPNMISNSNKITFAAKMLFAPLTTLTRLSLIAFYYRLVKDSGSRAYRRVLHLGTAYTVMVCFVFLLLAIFECIPTNAYWVFPPTGGHCMDEGRVLLGAGVLNSVSDLLTTVLPIPIVMRLQMPLKQRIGVCILLCLGGVVTVAGIVRIYFTWDSLIASWDESWRAYPLWIVTAVEVHLGLICACAPAWKTLLQKPFRELSSKIPKLSHPPDNSRTAAFAQKKTKFNALKSLPWFQHKRFDFERTRQDTGDFGLGRLTKLIQPSTLTTARSRPIVMDETAKAYDIGSGITVTKSVDQVSTHLNFAPLAPSHWIYHGSFRSSGGAEMSGEERV